MAIDVVSSASFPASEVLSQIVEAILETVVSANDVIFKKDTFKKLASYLERIVPVLKELEGKYISNSESLNNAIQILNREIKAAKQITLECSTKSKVYLLMNSRGIVRRLEGIMREINRALSLLPLASLELSSAIVVEIGNLCDSMQKAEFKAAIAEEEILEKIETGIQERKADRSYANNLLVLIAEAVGIPTERSALKKEFDDFKSEIENVRLRKDKSEAIQMDQIIALLERADAASSPKEKEMKYFTKRKSLGSQPLEPLQSFYCPITRDVMVDPVETSSGQIFERSAIEKWFTEVTYHFFHRKKGTPFGDDQGIYNGLTWWEQIDNGKQLTRNRKFLTVVPVVLYLIASHTTDYQHPMLFLNTLAVLVLVIAKFPNMHKARIFGINADK